MCILFVYIDNEAAEGYQVIIANNRDEIYARPTAPANVWKDHTHCISGVDMQPGREGGTWFGMSTKGKIACLLSILSPGKWKKSKKGRGFIIKDYLTDDCNAKEFLENLEKEHSEYNGFNLVILEKQNNKWHVMYSTNKDSNKPIPLEKDVFAISNSTIDVPWKKTTDGCKEFSNIVNKYNKRKQYDEDTDNNTDIVSSSEIDYDIDYEYDNNNNIDCVTRNDIIYHDEDKDLFSNSGIDGSTHYDSDNNKFNYNNKNNNLNKNNHIDNDDMKFDSKMLISVDSCYFSDSECETLGNIKRVDPFRFKKEEKCNHSNTNDFGLVDTDDKKVITDDYGTEKSYRMVGKEDMIDELFDFLSNTKQHMPDAQLSQQAETLSSRETNERSQIFVHSPTIKGGTMSSTLLLIDSHGHGEYIERYLKAPPTHEVHEPASQQWAWSTHQFNLEE